MSAPNARAARRQSQAAEAQGARTPVVQPGVAGGQYRPLTDGEIGRVNDAVMEVLSRIGMASAPPWLVELALARGCSQNARGRLLFPRALVEDVIAGAGRNFVLHGRDPRHDLEISGRRVHFGTGGAAVQTLDMVDGTHRPATLVDLYDFARLADRLDNVHWFTRCLTATDLPDPLELDINSAYAAAAGTCKHIGTSITRPENVAPVIAMLDQALGGEGRFAERPFCKLHSSPIVPALRYAEEACDVLREAVRHGMPISAITAGQAGATAPASLAGALVQTTAETLASLLMTNLIKPGHPMIFSNWPMVSDLRTGAFSGGGGEGAVLNAAAAQLIRHYDLPSGVAAGMTDSKLPDMQAGYEKALTNALAGLAGANLVYESSAMYGSLLSSSLEGFVIDNELLGCVLRAIRGIEISDDTLSIDLIEETVYGEGHYLGAGQTLALMRTEYLYPRLGDRRSPDVWQAGDASDIRERARAEVRSILGTHYPSYISPADDEIIRSRFPIRLDRAVMLPGNPRW